MDKIAFREIWDAQVRKSDDGGRKMTFVASDGTRDTAGTVLNVDGWDLERFNRNGIIGYQHKVYGSYGSTDDPDNVIGKGNAYVKDKKLLVDVEFEPEGDNALADKVYKKLTFGTLKAVSVGFIPTGKGKWGVGDENYDGRNPTYYYAGQQLLEISVVNIPANPNALKKSLIDEAVEEELKTLRAEAEDEARTEAEKSEEMKKESDDLKKKAVETLELEKEKSLTIARAALL